MKFSLVLDVRINNASIIECPHYSGDILLSVHTFHKAGMLKIIDKISSHHIIMVFMEEIVHCTAYTVIKSVEFLNYKTEICQTCSCL